MTLRRNGLIMMSNRDLLRHGIGIRHSAQQRFGRVRRVEKTQSAQLLAVGRSRVVRLHRHGMIMIMRMIMSGVSSAATHRAAAVE